MSETETAKIQLRDHLSSLLVPRIAEGFWSIYESSKQLCERNNQPDQILRTLQNMVTKIPDWSDSTLTEEVERILRISNCSYMDDLLMGVFLAYMKSFASLHYRGASSQVRVEFERPNVTKFIHELYKHSARKLWQTAYLFRTQQVTTEQQARNRNDIEQTVYKCMDDVIRTFLPWELIAKSYFSDPSGSEPPPHAPPPVNKSVVFEDIPDDSESESESEDEPPALAPIGLKLGEVIDDDALSFTDLDEKVEEVVVPVIPVELNPLEEIEKNMSSDTLVLNM
jgi:hypothetical protein